MFTVEGPTQRVVVVGAGLAGLSAAMRLAGAGRDVVILEREQRPGGRAGRIEADGFSFDTGPTVLTMPDLIDDAFAALGEDYRDWLDLIPLDPAYRAFYPDGSTLDVFADPERMAAEIESQIGPAEAAGYRRFVDYVATMYRLEIRDFIDRNLDSPLDLMSPNLLRLIAKGGLGRLQPRVNSFLKDPRTQRLFSFQAMYAGLSPYKALALYSVISYMDSVAGVYLPKGGMHALPQAMADAAVKHGVTIHYGVTVDSVETVGDRATAVTTIDGTRFPADAVVLNPDLPIAYRDLLGLDGSRLERLDYSPSCWLMLAGSSASYSKIAHHNIHFGHAWRRSFDEVLSGNLMSDPSFLVTNPSHSDPSLVPAGKQSYYVLFITPNTRGNVSWPNARFRDNALRIMEERGYVGFADAIEFEDITTPADWQARGMEAGAPFSAAHSLFQTGPFRSSNHWGANVVFTGSGTQPGVGVPMVLVSGRLAAERITGVDPAYRSAAWR
ncbi:MAG: phytoene desaturase [Actinobacteria bacterium]|nr:phytoene desaturase [Micrococcales bacterium]MCB0903078.1 phytoene desaturase [Actinomycetota bacterium]MCO5298954.1 phytoene desaturase family protein [Candidatus Nanopelagicales bacterium]MCB9428847.1 phytoene desaturase [Actinomycetota bacterium]HPE11482.1 phytoene desaturase family protein [Actinomycetota bacterium]